MTRTRSSAKGAGAKFERAIADHLKAALDDDRIDRRTKTGAKDRGDIGGIRHMGGRLVIECKDYGGRLQPAPWTAEAEIERGGDQWVLMTVDQLVAILTGEPPRRSA